MNRYLLFGHEIAIRKIGAETAHTCSKTRSYDVFQGRFVSIPPESTGISCFVSYRPSGRNTDTPLHPQTKEQLRDNLS